MAVVTNDKSLWVKSFKRLITNLYKELEQLKATLSKDTKGAAFKLIPQRIYAEEAFMECRFEVFPKDADMAVQDKDAVRIVLVFEKDYKPLVPGICEFLRGKFPGDLQIRSNTNASRVYITKPNLPTLDLTVHVSQQVDSIKQYGEACSQLHRLWNTHVMELDTYMKTAKS